MGKARVFLKEITYIVFPYKFALSLSYYIRFRRKIKWKKPIYFSEKIQLRKLNLKEIYSSLSDKHLCREYVRKKGLGEILVEQVLHAKKLNSDILRSLPNDCIIKINNGSGDGYMIMENKNLPYEKLANQFNSLLNKNFSKASGEKHYESISPVFVVDKLISRKVPLDYKFHCFNNGTVFKWYLQVDADRYSSQHTRSYYDDNLKLIEVNDEAPYVPRKYEKLEKPENFEYMIKVAKLLSSDFDYVRIDLYNIEGKVYFGEFTFTTHNGFVRWTNPKFDLEMGSHWNNE